MLVGEVFSLIRVKQWYKNLLVFVPLIFAGNLFSPQLLLLTFLGFVAFCLVSSLNYVINDLVDVKSDRCHPEKKNRPLASGRISKNLAVLLIVLLAIGAILVSSLLPFMFRVILITFFILTQIYTFFFKNILFADLLFIGVNFVLRAVSGAFVMTKGFVSATGNNPYVVVSPWLIVAPFFLALLLVVSRREADHKLLGHSSKNYKKILQEYTPDLTGSLMNILTATLLIIYAIYSVFSYEFSLLISFPFAIYCLFRWFYLVKTGSIISRHPELIYKDTPMIIGGVLWIVSAILAIYVL
ncbi:MAG: UbiA family prenyltransferase [Candidatus Nanoarchaeia archaeon]